MGTVGLIIIMLVGGLIGFQFKGKKHITKWFDLTLTIAIYFLLFILGASIGSNKEVFTMLPTLGYQALIITLAALLGSFLLAMLLAKAIFKD